MQLANRLRNVEADVTVEARRASQMHRGLRVWLHSPAATPVLKQGRQVGGRRNRRNV